MSSKPSHTTPRPRTLGDEAKISPSSVYEHPRQIVRSHVLTDRQKSEILDQWEADAIAMQTASGEGMTGGAPSRLDDVQKAQTDLREITAGRGAAHGRGSSPMRPGAVHNDNVRDGQTVDGQTVDGQTGDGQTVISGGDARQGVTGNNVRYILAISLAGVIASFVLVARYLGAI